MGGEDVEGVEASGPDVQLRLTAVVPQRRGVGNGFVAEDLCRTDVNVGRRQVGEIVGA